MPSPFPGMDPYLEHPKLWPAFQHHLLACLYQILLPGLVDRYRARSARAVTSPKCRCSPRSSATSTARSSSRFAPEPTTSS